MMKNIMLATVLTAVLSCGAAYAADKPNIVVIWGDDIGWYNISAYNMAVLFPSAGK